MNIKENVYLVTIYTYIHATLLNIDIFKLLSFIFLTANKYSRVKSQNITYLVIHNFFSTILDSMRKNLIFKYKENRSKNGRK